MPQCQRRANVGHVSQSHGADARRLRALFRSPPQEKIDPEGKMEPMTSRLDDFGIQLGILIVIAFYIGWKMREIATCVQRIMADVESIRERTVLK